MRNQNKFKYIKIKVLAITMKQNISIYANNNKKLSKQVSKWVSIFKQQQQQQQQQEQQQQQQQQQQLWFTLKKVQIIKQYYESIKCPLWGFAKKRFF